MNADYARTVQLLLAVAPAIFSSQVQNLPPQPQNIEF